MVTRRWQPNKARPLDLWDKRMPAVGTLNGRSGRMTCKACRQ